MSESMNSQEDEIRFKRILQLYPNAPDTYLELIGHSELTVALENFCLDVSFLNIPLTEEIFEELKYLADCWNVSDQFLEAIRENIDIPLKPDNIWGASPPLLLNQKK
jgi:hypothetical protein